MKKIILVAGFLLPSICASADEGMFTFNNAPVKAIAEKYGFTPTQAWLDRVRLASVRLARGCSGSFVSKDGLVLTNHHCAHSCIEQISTAKQDFVASGYTAAALADEKKCPDVEINQLVEISNVTDRIAKATDGKEGQAFADALKAEQAAIQKECATAPDLRCDVVTLYQGGRYDLYKYRRYQDVRLVFAPEKDIAFFGGDPDNFNFPRYDLDMALMRVYGADGKPLKVDTILPFAKASPADGELTFTSGHPGSTSRGETVAQLQADYELITPSMMTYYSEVRGMVAEFGRRGAEQTRISETLLFGVENSLKVFKGHFQALGAEGMLVQKAKAEADLRAKVDADPALKPEVGGAWDGIAKAVAVERSLWTRYATIEGGRTSGFSGDLFSNARTLLRAAEERTKPNGERLREYTDANLPFVAQRVTSTAPIYPEFEVERLAFSLTKLREYLSPDDPLVKQVLGKDSPAVVAERLVKNTKLADPKLRKQLFDGGKAAVDASHDPMLQLVRLVDPEARAVRKRWENEVDAPIRRYGAQIARARFKIEGENTYPDATFTLRLSYGAVAGWTENGKQVPSHTLIAGLYERATGSDPFRLPKSWVEAKPSLDPQTPMNFVTTNDIVGGNSGSPILNKNAELVGLAFDGNIHSLGGDYGFDPALNRCVGVDVMAIRAALAKVYKADRILRELENGDTRAELDRTR
jgi:hypothetical protein